MQQYRSIDRLFHIRSDQNNLKMADFSSPAMKIYFVIEARTAWARSFDLHTCESVMGARLRLRVWTPHFGVTDRHESWKKQWGNPVLFDGFTDASWPLATVTRTLELYFSMKTWIKSLLHLFSSCVSSLLWFIYFSSFFMTGIAQSV